MSYIHVAGRKFRSVSLYALQRFPYQFRVGAVAQRHSHMSSANADFRICGLIVGVSRGSGRPPDDSPTPRN